MAELVEQWRPIEGYDGLYEVSNLGKVRSFKWGREKILRPVPDKKGYLRVGLRKEGKQKWFMVHRLVAQAFLPNPEGLPQINHKNENKTLNVVFLNDDRSVDEYRSNLEWCDCTYNINYGTRNERGGKNSLQTNIRNGRYDPELCGLTEKERKRLYRQKNLEKMREYQREWVREYRRRKKQKQTT